jgi:hypothetical protein
MIGASENGQATYPNVNVPAFMAEPSTNIIFTALAEASTPVGRPDRFVSPR